MFSKTYAEPERGTFTPLCLSNVDVFLAVLTPAKTKMDTSQLHQCESCLDTHKSGH